MDKTVEAFDFEKGKIHKIEKGNLKIQKLFFGQLVLACWLINTTNISVTGTGI